MNLIGTLIIRGANSAKFKGGWRGNPLPGSILKKVHFLAFLRKTIKKDQLLDFHTIERSTF